MYYHTKKKYCLLIGIIFEMRFLNLRINFYLLRTFCPHLGSFQVNLLQAIFKPEKPLQSLSVWVGLVVYL